MDPDDILDVVGIGFGPANLALAIALDEHARQLPAGGGLRAEFFERQERFGWHRGMLIDDATMQVSFLKDLVTQRNPSSDFSFVSYLHGQGRLSDFINHKTLFPLRIEFHDYLEWAAARMADVVRYGCEVVDVVPVRGVGDEVVALDVHAADGAGRRIVRRARNVVLATGLELALPPGVRATDRVWHNLDLLHRVARMPAGAAPQRFVVVGAGQSAAEVAAFLHRRFDTAEVCAVFGRYGYSPADDSPFANRIFDPEAVDTYFGAPEAVKRRLFDYHRNTNYSVVDLELIDDLYRRSYAERVQGRQRLRIMGASCVEDVAEDAAGVDVTVADLAAGGRETLRADALVYATGYRPVDPGRTLGTAAALCARAEDGRLAVGRDYRAAGVPGSDAVGIYLQGGTEATHGITSTLLSNVAIRAGEIVASVAARPAPRGAVLDATARETTAAGRPA